MGFDFTFIERYVSSSVSYGNHTGTIDDPWNFLEACEKVQNGERVNVMEGVYYIEPNDGLTFKWCFPERAGTAEYPVVWRGYGGKATLLPAPSWNESQNYIYISPPLSSGGDTSFYRWLAKDFIIQVPNRSSQGLLYANNAGPIFYNCHIENTANGTTNYAYAIGLGRGAFIACYIKNNNRHTSGPGYLFNSNGHFVYGCYCDCYGSFVSTLNLEKPFMNNIVVTRNPVVGSDNSKIATSASSDEIYQAIANNVFKDFPIGFEVGTTSLMKIPLMNNIFYNVGLPITPISTGVRARYFMMGNRCYGQSLSFPEERFGPLNIDDDIFSMKALIQSPFRSETDFRLVDGPCVNGALPQFMHDSLDPEKFLVGMDVGPLQVEPEIDYPSQDDVRSDTQYADGFFTGNLRVPAVGDVRRSTVYDSTNQSKQKTGVLFVPANIPAESDVRAGTEYDSAVYNQPNTGTCAVPAASDVKLSVPVDDTVGTFDARRNITFKDSSHVIED